MNFSKPQVLWAVFYFATFLKEWSVDGVFTSRTQARAKAQGWQTGAVEAKVVRYVPGEAKAGTKKPSPKRVGAKKPTGKHDKLFNAVFKPGESTLAPVGLASEA